MTRFELWSLGLLQERKSKLKMWHRAAQFLEENESRVRTESQQIEGDDYPVWRWLPPSYTNTLQYIEMYCVGHWQFSRHPRGVAAPLN